MNRTRPEQAILSRDTDLSKTAETKATIERMVDGLNDHRIDDIGEFFSAGFQWMGNTGCGTKRGLDEFERAWYKPFRDAFGDRHFATEHYLEDGDWAACFGHCEATHHGDFMGIAPTGKRIKIPYIDVWRVENEKIAENRVSVDFPAILAQLGHDIFNGQGWDQLDSKPPKNASLSFA
jgi:predicted ester cyclase